MAEHTTIATASPSLIVSPEVPPVSMPTDATPPARPWLAHYEAGVSASITVPTMPLAQLLANAAQKYGDQPALRMVLKYLPLGQSIASRMTYRELDQASSRFAAGLHRLGIQPGDRVALMLPNLPQSVVAYFGVLKAGGIVVNTNPTYTPRELTHLLCDSGAETIVTLSGLYDTVAQVRAETSLKRIILTDIPDTLRWPLEQLVARQVRRSGMLKDIPTTPDVYRYADLMRTVAPLPAMPSAPDDVALLQYTGGTTGRAKAAMLTNANLLGNVSQLDAWMVRAEHGREKVLGAIPFFHVYGMTVAMLYGLSIGAELFTVPDPRDTAQIMQIIHHEGITYYPGVPALYVALINHPDRTKYNLCSIKACLSGGAPLPVEVAQQFEQLTNGRLIEGFGMTECSPVACANPVFGQRRIGSIGVPLPATEAAIVALSPNDDGSYTRLAQGEDGELIVRGPQVMQGYWNQPDETDDTIDSEGWLHTGDIARMDAEGYCYIVDRKKDLIIASGYNIVPREVEEVLFMHPQVLEAAVIGVPDPRRGETVKAFVVLKPEQTATAEEMIAHCKQHLAPYKVPKLLEFRDDLPKSQVGKILRRVLLAEEKRKLGMAG